MGSYKPRLNTGMKQRTQIMKSLWATPIKFKPIPKEEKMKEEPKYNDYPLDEIGDACMNLIAKGATIYQKFTCTSCGKRLMMDIPNTLFTEGTCDSCGHVTDIRETGCNYLVTAKNLSAKEIKEILDGPVHEVDKERGN